MGWWKYAGTARSLNRLIGTDLNINKNEKRRRDGESTIKNKCRLRVNEQTMAYMVAVAGSQDGVAMMSNNQKTLSYICYIRMNCAKCIKVWRSKRMVHLMRHILLADAGALSSLFGWFNAIQSICAELPDVEWLRPISN